MGIWKNVLRDLNVHIGGMVFEKEIHSSMMKKSCARQKHGFIRQRKNHL